MPSLFGRKRSFSSKAAAEQFVRHLTRELTAGGIPHWVELKEDAGAQPARGVSWVPVLHRAACAGGDACECERD